MFGITRRPKGLFGAPPTYGTPPIAPDPRETMGVPGLGMQSPEQPAKRGLGTRLFGNGWEDKAFAIGGILQGDGGQAYRELQHQKMAPLLAQAQREAEFADWQRKQQWERDHPKPTNNDTVADYEFIRQTLGDEEAKKFLKNKASPIMWRQGPDGQFYPMAPPSGGDAPDTLPADFDFGDGGGAPSGTGTFPR